VVGAVTLAVCLGILAWFSGRARLGARARSLGGVRLRAVERLAVAVDRVSLARATAGLLAGAAAGGLSLALAGTAGGLAWEPLSRARLRRARSQHVDRQLPDALRATATALRAGRNLAQAIECARDEVPAPLHVALDAAVRHMQVGAPLGRALDVFAETAGSTEAAAAAETMRIGRAAGANLPAILDAAVESLVDRERLARDRRAATAQARMSAMVVGSMPLAFFVTAGSGGRAQLRTLLHDPIGWVLLAAGLGLEAVGFLWTRALVRQG